MGKDKSWNWYTNEIIRQRKVELQARRERFKLEKDRANLEKILRESVKNG